MTNILLDKGDLLACFTRLASVCLFEEANGRSSINVRTAVSKITSDNEEAAAIWERAESQAKRYHTTAVPKLQELADDVRHGC